MGSKKSDPCETDKPDKPDYRQMGIDAFYGGEGISDYPSELTKVQRVIWKSGYLYAQNQEEKRIEDEKWKEFSIKCPWNFQGYCRAIADDVGDECKKTNCAPLYFIQNYQE